MTSIKTQKAVGIIHGISTLLDDNPAMSNFVGEIDNQLIRVEENIDLSFIQFPCFARPCPKTPRHGFVDSRIVKNKIQLKKLWKEVKEQDPDGEIIVGPFVKNPSYNAVYVGSGTLSVGPGNDGATGGKDSVSFPVAPQKFDKYFLELVRIKRPDVVYLESVHNRKAGWHLTQVRGGPAQKGGKKDFIPKKVKVQKIVMPVDDLLEWERSVKTLAAGTVVYGPGHTLASHAAVHCIIHNIPFVTTFKPNVGDILKPTERKKSSLPIYRSQFRKGVVAALSNISKDPKKDLGFSLATLHNWAYLRKSEDAGWVLAAAATLLVRLGTALVFGEYRHIKGGPKGSRDNIYKKVMTSGSSYLYKTPAAFKCFYQDQWSDSFGGIPWANCAWYSYDIGRV